MLSRVADSLYWMSRYLERAEHTARLIDVQLSQMLEDAGMDVDLRWQRLLRCLRTPLDAQAGAYDITYSLTFDQNNPSSIVSCIEAARENARQVREQISSEMWEQLNRLFLRVKQTRMEQIWSAEPHRFLTSVKEGIYLFHGIIDATMNHNEGWHFIRVGRFLERATSIATLVDAHFAVFPIEGNQYESDPLGYLSWVGLLRSCASFEGYCKVHTAVIRPAQVVEFLLLNADAPRSVRFACARMQDGLQAIANATGTRNSGRVERLTGRLRASLDYYQIDEILSDDMHEYLDGIQRQCALIHNGLYQVYLAYPIEVAMTSRSAAHS
jgi:uncharacterized alpha-E superfamily protein